MEKNQGHPPSGHSQPTSNIGGILANTLVLPYAHFLFLRVQLPEVNCDPEADDPSSDISSEAQ